MVKLDKQKNQKAQLKGKDLLVKLGKLADIKYGTDDRYK